MIIPVRAWFESILKRFPRHFLVAFSVVALLLFLEVTKIINCRERDAYDWRMKHRTIEKAHRDIVILAVDDLSLQALGPWPWRRTLHAELLNILKATEPKFVFFDVIFPERSQDPQDDLAFADAIKNSGNVSIPFHYIEKPFHLLFPIPEFKEYAREGGYVNVIADPRDGVVREIKPFLSFDGQTYSYCGLSVFLHLFEHVEDRSSWIEEFKRINKQRMLVNYPGGLESFQRLSVGEVFEKSKTPEGREFLKRVLNRKMILIGDISTGSSDVRTIPLQPAVPGIVIPASTLNTVLTGHYLREIPMLLNYLLAFFLSWLIAFYGQKLRPHWAVITTFAQIAVYIVINCLIFSQLRIVLHLPMPIVAMITTFIVSLFMRYGDVRMEMAFLARELDMASKIQQSILPGTELKLKELEAGFRCLFYERVGGDLYDWLDLGEGRVAVCLGDVSGKGVPAALYMSRALNELRHQVTRTASPGEILTLLNKHLSQGETSGMFLTLFFIIIDSKAKKIRYSNAGHDPMVFFHAKENRADLIADASGLPIGIMEDQVFETGEISFDSGDMLLVTSDGIKEQKSPKGEMFGSERLQASLAKAVGAKDPGAVIDSVMADVLSFASGRSPHDDRTLLCVKILGNS